MAIINPSLSYVALGFDPQTFELREVICFESVIDFKKYDFLAKKHLNFILLRRFESIFNSISPLEVL